MKCNLTPNPSRGSGYFICSTCGTKYRGSQNRECKGMAEIHLSVSDKVTFTQNPRKPRLENVVEAKKRTGRLRIGLVTPALLLGGAEMWMLMLTKYIDRSLIDYQGTCITHGFYPLDTSLGKAFLETGALYIGKEGLKTLAENCDILVVWGIPNYDEIAPEDYKGKLVLVSHGCCSWTTHIYNNCKKHATHFVAVSEDAQMVFDKDIKSTVIWNGADVERCRDKGNRNQIRAKMGLKETDIAVGYFGRLSWEKNAPAIPTAVRHLGPPYKSVIIGKAYDKENIVIQQCREIDPDLIHLPPMPPDDALHALDCFILASPSEGFSLALIEAWLCRCPVVCTAVGSVPELTKAFGTVATIVSRTPGAEELGLAVKKAIADKGLVDKMHFTALQHLTASKMGENWTKYLLSIGD